MKNIIKMVLLTLLVTIASKSEANKQAIVPQNGPYIDIRDFNYILHHRMEIPKGDFISPVTGQKYKIYADLKYYMLDLKAEDIDKIIILSWRDVKKGQYRNNSYDANGMKVPMQPEYGDILRGLHNELTFFCTPDSVAIAKRDCGNEQDYKPYYVAYVAPIITTQPAKKPEPVVLPDSILTCWGTMYMGEQRFNDDGDLAIGKFTIHHKYYMEYGYEGQPERWYKFVGTTRQNFWLYPQKGDWQEIFCPKIEEPKKEVPVACDCPPTKTTPVVEVEKHSHYRHVEKKQRFFAISFQPNYNRGYYQQPQRQRYQQPRQRYTYQQPRQRYVQPKFGGNSSNGGSSGGGSSNGGSNGGSSNGGGNSGGGGSNGGGGNNGQNQRIPRGR